MILRGSSRKGKKLRCLRQKRSVRSFGLRENAPNWRRRDQPRVRVHLAEPICRQMYRWRMRVMETRFPSCLRFDEGRVSLCSVVRKSHQSLPLMHRPPLTYPTFLHSHLRHRPTAQHRLFRP